MISRKIKTLAARFALPAGVLSLLFCTQATALDVVLESRTVNLQKVSAKWIDRATIEVTIYGNVQRFFDRNIDDSGSGHNTYRVTKDTSPTCTDSKLTFPKGTLSQFADQLNGYADITLYAQLQGAITSNSASNCIKADPDPIPVRVANKANADILFKQYQDSDHIIRVDNNFEWLYTRDPTHPNVFLKNSESECKDILLVEGGRVRSYELSKNSGDPLPSEIASLAPNCKLAHIEHMGVNVGSPLVLGALGSGTLATSSTGQGSASSGNAPSGSSGGGSVQPTAESPCKENSGSCDTECNDAEESAKLNLGDGSKGGCIYKYVNMFINFLTAGVGIIIVIMVIIGGYGYLTSSGDPQKAAAARGRIANALIALMASILMYAVLQWLIPGGIF